MILTPSDMVAQHGIYRVRIEVDFAKIENDLRVIAKTMFAEPPLKQHAVENDYIDTRLCPHRSANVRSRASAAASNGQPSSLVIEPASGMILHPSQSRHKARLLWRAHADKEHPRPLAFAFHGCGIAGPGSGVTAKWRAPVLFNSRRTSIARSGWPIT